MDVGGARIRRASRGVLALALSISLLLSAGPNPAQAYTQNVYVSSFNNFQAKCAWCVVASAITWLKYISGSTIPSPSSMSSYMTSKDRYPGQSGSCIDPSDGRRYYGHDPRGWAWGMFNYSPPAWYFNDYKNSSRTWMEWEFVYGVRGDGNPTGAIVEGGVHAIDILGYYTLNDPFADLAKTLYGYYIFDPWYGRGNSGMPNWPYNGFAPDSYVTIGNWNSLYYLPDTFDGVFWNGLYDGVLRSTSGTPSDTPPQTYGDYRLNGGTSPAPAPDPGPRSLAVGSTSPELSEAVSNGLQENALGSGASLGIDLTGYSLGPVVHVESLAKDVPSYDLVELQVAGKVRAVALVSLVAEGYRFGAITPVTSEPAVMSLAGRTHALAANGLTGSGELVWAPSTSGSTPFGPFVRGEFADGHEGFLTPKGRVTGIQLLPGFTPSGR